MNKIRKAVLLALTALIVIVQAGCAGKTKEPVIRHNFYFDTVCSIAIYDMADMSVNSAAATSPCFQGPKRERISTGSITHRGLLWNATRKRSR